MGRVVGRRVVHDVVHDEEGEVRSCCSGPEDGKMIQNRRFKQILASMIFCFLQSARYPPRRG